MEAVADNARDPRPLGQLFADERERQGLTRAEMAQRLHMSPWQIEALEGGDYSRLPKGTFLRGFVRNYAKALGIEPDAALSRLAEAAPAAPAPGIVVPSQNIRFDPLGERLAGPYMKAGALAVVLVALGFAAMYWWLFIRPMPPGAATPAKGPPQQVAEAPVPAPQPVAPAPAPTLPEPAAPEAASPADVANAAAQAESAKVNGARDAEAQQAPAAPASARAGAGERTLRFVFRGESWVEVRDADGRVLMQRLHEPGSEAQLAGRPPFSVIVGNAPEVQMFYGGRPFALEPHTRVAVARFTLE